MITGERHQSIVPQELEVIFHFNYSMRSFSEKATVEKYGKLG